MNWENIKRQIINELFSDERRLKNPKIRNTALTSIERMLGEMILANPIVLMKIGKEDLIASLQKLKKLNSAEKSIINHIYSVLTGVPIAIKKRKS